MLICLYKGGILWSWKYCNGFATGSSDSFDMAATVVNGYQTALMSSVEAGSIVWPPPTVWQCSLKIRIICTIIFIYLIAIKRSNKRHGTIQAFSFLDNEPLKFFGFFCVHWAPRVTGGGIAFGDTVKFLTEIFCSTERIIPFRWWMVLMHQSSVFSRDGDCLFNELADEEHFFWGNILATLTGHDNKTKLIIYFVKLETKEKWWCVLSHKKLKNYDQIQCTMPDLEKQKQSIRSQLVIKKILHINSITT